MRVPSAGVVAIQVLLMVFGSPILVGVMRKVRARLEGRQGAPVSQPLRDLRKLLRKERIRPEHASWVFTIAPPVIVSGAVLVAGIIPTIAAHSPLDGIGDLFAVVSLLLLGTVSLALAGLDPGTAFGGMGSSREMTITALAEPTLLLGVFALSIPAGSTNLSAIVRASLADPGRAIAPATVLAFVALAIATLAETGRLPVDNPSTHLELTMIHEAMVLEYAGSDLALVELAAWMRLGIFLGLLANLFAPWGIARTSAPEALAIGAVVFTAKVVFLGVVLAVFEVFVAKLRLFRVPELLSVSFALAFLSIAVSFFLR